MSAEIRFRTHDSQICSVGDDVAVSAEKFTLGNPLSKIAMLNSKSSQYEIDDEKNLLRVVLSLLLLAPSNRRDDKDNDETLCFHAHFVNEHA